MKKLDFKCKKPIILDAKKIREMEDESKRTKFTLGDFKRRYKIK